MKHWFSAICMSLSHVLSSFLSRPKQHQYHMRTRAHNFSLPPKDETFTETFTEYFHFIIIISSSSSSRPATVLVFNLNLHNCTLSYILSRFHSFTITRPPSSQTATVAPRCFPGLTFPDFDLAPKRNEKF